MACEGELYIEGEYWLDAMLFAVKLAKIHESVRPADIYIALLESDDVKHYRRGDLSSPYTECLSYMGLLIPLDLFTYSTDVVENGYDVITEYTIFKPVFGNRFDYFVEKNRNAEAICDVA
jgi:hypothetical protein